MVLKHEYEEGIKTAKKCTGPIINGGESLLMLQTATSDASHYMYAYIHSHKYVYIYILVYILGVAWPGQVRVGQPGRPTRAWPIRGESLILSPSAKPPAPDRISASRLRIRANETMTTKVIM